MLSAASWAQTTYMPVRIPPPAIAASFTPSRTSGVAPLYVFFDATASTAAALTSVPFHEIEYTWSFGDTAGGATWSVGSGAGVNSKNAARGPIAAHVFETPGEYTVTLSARYSSSTGSDQVVITVTDPDTVFAADATLCVANVEPTAGSGGCPAGADVLESSDFDSAINTTAGSGATYKRILFNRGDTFNVSANSDITSIGPGLIGAFGTGDRPIVAGNDADGVFRLGPASGTISDWRIMDLDMQVGDVANSEGVMLRAGFNQLLFLRVRINQSGGGILMDPGTLDDRNRAAGNTSIILFDQIGIVDCEITNMNDDAGLYIGAQRFAVMGNQLGPVATAGGHVTRYIGTYKHVISNNQIEGATDGLSLIKLHGPPWGTLLATTTSGSPTLTNLRNTDGQGVTGGDYVAQLVQGSGIPAGSYRNSGSLGSLTMNQNATATADDVAITVSGVASRVANGYSDQIVVSDNRFIGNTDVEEGGWWVAISPQSFNSASGHDDRIRNAIVERNWLEGGSGSPTALGPMHADLVTLRNNLIDISDTDAGTCIWLDQQGPIVPGPVDNWVYNNTCYSSAANGMIVVQLGGGPGGGETLTNITLRNNLAYGPSTSSRDALDGTATNLTTSNNSSDAQILTDPNFATDPPTAPAHFRPESGYAVDGGEAVPVWDDFFGQVRNGTYDIGAVNP